MKNNIKSYSELIHFSDFDERFNYLKLDGSVGRKTFGFDRYVNQRFYKSLEWRRVRDYVIARDYGCDLGVEGYEIHNRILIHHMNPIMLNDINECSDFLLNPEYLISTAHTTHNAIHYSDTNMLSMKPIERTRNDTCPWKK